MVRSKYTSKDKRFWVPSKIWFAHRRGVSPVFMASNYSHQGQALFWYSFMQSLDL
jgi:hypothetical protein